MTDALAFYGRGLARLLEKLGSAHPSYAPALTLQARLQENIAESRRYGNTETRKSERAQIVDALNRLALESVGTSFNQLSGIADESALDGASSTDDPRSSGSLTNNVTSFHGPVYGPVHTGSGDIHANMPQDDSLRDRGGRDDER